MVDVHFELCRQDVLASLGRAFMRRKVRSNLVRRKNPRPSSGSLNPDYSDGDG
jgi:hypothetical protein